MLDAVVGLGANLGDRLDSLRRAARLVLELGEPRGVSAVYETAPVGLPQPDFLNAALRLLTPHEPQALLDALLDIERVLGRVRRERWGPRIIDLDLLWCADRGVNDPRLVVPHPDLRARAFALRPLLDVAPEAADPNDGTRYADVLAALGEAGVREIAGTRAGWLEV